MCGMTGGWSRGDFRDLAEALPRMTAALYHRGPDGEGHWSDAEAGIALGHRRLAIVDLSPAGRQPMASASGRWMIAFNGEIYNHLELRSALEKAGAAPPWRGHSDTETLLAAIEAWGFEVALQRCVGMFAIALWDRSEHCLWLARDRLGEKPLYYGWSRGCFLFGSELKALRQLPGFDAPLDREALALYLRYNAIPAPFTIHRGIRKLLPGCWLKLDRRSLDAGHLPEPSAYWSATEQAARSIGQPFVGSESEAVDALDGLLRQAVAGQMVADVPLGALLSGGIDSSVVVSLMQAQSSRPVRTYSIGFHEAAYNEAQQAAAVARHLGTDHTELYLSADDALAIIPRLAQIYDEPFADSSQIPTCLVSKLTRQHVTVALSGDGGDELFGGYTRYFLASRLWKKLGHVPRPVRHWLSRALTALPPQRWDSLYRRIQPMIPARSRIGLFGDKLHKGAQILGVVDGRALYRGLISTWRPADVLLDAIEPASFGPRRANPPRNLTEYMMLEDACHYMADDILTKVDRAAMAFALETRVPMLDHRVFEFAWRLPLHHKVHAGVGKRILRQVLYRYVPQALVDRPKMGFGVPIDGWLRGPLKEWAAAMLDPERLRREGLFDPRPIQRKWQEHLSGKRNWQYHLWVILMFQAWRESADSADAGRPAVFKGVD